VMTASARRGVVKRGDSGPILRVDSSHPDLQLR